jgi:hypothetical protein
MAFLGDEEEGDEEVEEVSIKASKSDSSSDSDLKMEARQKFSDDSSDVDLEDVHEQNKRIISMLEELTGRDNDRSREENEDVDVGGAMDGVL